MARPGQIEFIEDLLEAHGLDRKALAHESGEESWANFERLHDEVASEVIEWLRDYGKA